LARLNLTRPRLFGFGLAVASLAFAACGGKSTTPTPVSTATAAPTPTGSAPSSLQSPCASTLGVAYEPDGGNGNGFNGVQVTHFEDNGQHLCAAVLPTSAPGAVTFADPVGPLAISIDSSDSVALLYNTATGGYSFAQDVFGASVAQLVPVGVPYNLSVTPTPVPSASAAATLAPATMTDATSITILDDGSLGVALVVSPNTSPQSIVALTSLLNAPPQFGNSLPYVGATNTLKNPSSTSFGNVVSSTDTSGASNVLVRGTTDLIAIGVTGAANGYQFNIASEDTNLGSGVPLRGSGRMAINPSTSARALVGGTSGGSTSVLTLVTGLPTTITEQSKLSLPGAINSIAFTPSYGTYAVIGTTAGIVVVGGTNSSALGILTPFGPGVTAYRPTFTNCNGSRSTMTDILSVGFSVDLQYLVALGVGDGVSCASGRNATLIAIPFGAATGATPAPAALPTPTAAPSGSPKPSPFPTFFQQNNVIAPPTNADYLYVH
jgi:hypothetical protein